MYERYMVQKSHCVVVEWLGDFVLWLDEEVFDEDFEDEVGGVAGVELVGVACNVLQTELGVTLPAPDAVSENNRFRVPPLNIAFTSSHA